MTKDEAARIDVPVLIAVGSTDDVAGSASALGAIIPGSEVLDIPNRDHMRAVGDKVYWDDTNKYLTSTATSNKWVGIATKAALAADATVRLRLNGFGQ